MNVLYVNHEGRVLEFHFLVANVDISRDDTT
jgi:hypothetical protein